MPNKTKAEIRHAKLAAKAENAARESLENDKGINKNERLVKKANKLNKRKNLGKDDIAFGMKPPYSMEDLSGDGKITKKDVLIGAGVLDKEGNKVNKMKPYRMDPSSNHTFRKNVVKKMEAFGDTVYKLDPTSLSLSDPNKLSGLQVNDKGNLDGNLVKVDDIINEPITRTKLYKDLDPSIVEAAKKFNLEKYGTHNPTAQGLTNNTVLDGFNKLVKVSDISQPGTPEIKGDAFTSYDKRQRARGIKFEENLISRKDKKGKRLGEVISKLEGKESLNKRQQRRLANLKSRQEKNTRIKNRLENVNKISQKQENQAINPKFYGKNRITLQEGTKGSSTTPADSNFISFKDFVSGKSTGNTTFVKSMKPVYQMKGYKMKGCSYKNKK